MYVFLYKLLTHVGRHYTDGVLKKHTQTYKHTYRYFYRSYDLQAILALNLLPDVASWMGYKSLNVVVQSGAANAPHTKSGPDVTMDDPRSSAGM